MGNGKGNPEYYVAEIQPGKVLYEMDGVDEALAREAFALAAAKLPIRTTFVVASAWAIGESDRGESVKAKRLREKNADELQKELEALQKEQFGLAHAARHAAADQYESAE